MKLYATTTSERASKGQGGNEYLEIIISGEQQTELARIMVSPGERDAPAYLTVYIDGKHVHEWATHLKGNKQKDEFMACEACGLDIKIRRDTNDKIILENCRHCDN